MTHRATEHAYTKNINPTQHQLKPTGIQKSHDKHSEPQIAVQSQPPFLLAPNNGTTRDEIALAKKGGADKAATWLTNLIVGLARHSGGRSVRSRDVGAFTV
jgi:hypothetical protein